MNKTVKQFIEEHVDLIDFDLPTVLKRAYIRLKNMEFEEFIFVLHQANIDFDTIRTNMLKRKLGFVFPLVDDFTSLENVVDEQLLSRTSTFFGLTKTELIAFIVENSFAWEDTMYLQIEDGKTYVRIKG